MDKLRIIQPQIFEKIENSQPELKFTGSYKKSVFVIMLQQNLQLGCTKMYVFAYTVF